jgi:osmotically-inducible protein OsmY
LKAKNIKDVHADVDDGIVTLTGSVKLESVRTGLEYTIRHLPNVAGVHNQVVLDPPPINDKTLFGRLSVNLRNAGFDAIRIRAHNGAVTLIGIVRTQRDRNSVIRIAWDTGGVREVFSRLSVAY